MAELHICNKVEKAEKGFAWEQKVREYIEADSTGYFEEALEKEDSLEVFLQLSELRKGLFNWYDFKPGAEILEIGAGFGALTGMLCEKAEHVIAIEPSLFRAQNLKKRYEHITNLDIYTDEVQKIEFQKKFDYIILTGVLETVGNGEETQRVYEDYLRELSFLLKEKGKLLLAVDNRYGLKYFCGTSEPYTNIPFAGLNHYPNGTKGYSFSRQELTEILKRAGLAEYKFYYPLPDYKLPQIIYSENYLPENNIRERLIPYYEDASTLVINEKLLYDDIVQNGVFEFFANSFLVECGTSDDFCQVNYAAVSTDRGRERSFATKIYSYGRVRKIPLYAEGRGSAENFISNIDDLNRHGIPVVACEMEGEGITMPYIQGKTLSNYMKELVRTNQDAFLQVFDKLYQYILKSSELVSQEENGLKKRWDTPDSLDWGPVLKRAYIELIPLNCFYLEDGQFLFFDQEFVRENYPAKYVLYRAIKYVYCFTSDAEKYVPVKRLKDKYNMNDVWEYFQKEEDLFLEEVRNQKRYQQFYRWARIDSRLLQENAKKLGKQNKPEFVVSDKMKRVWEVELDLLEKLDKVCKKNDLRYFLIHGTLLGAVRHKGFIPWDDDLDVAMPRKDYEKLKEIAAQEFEFPYFLQTPENDPNTYNNGHLRLRNSNTTGMETKDIGHDSNLGIWIDILVLDDGVLDEKKRGKKQKRIRRVQYLLNAKTYGAEVTQFGSMKEKEWRRYVLESKFYSRKKLCEKLKKEQLRYSSGDSPDIVIYSEGKYRPFAKKDFENVVFLEFEGNKYPAPAGYKHWLEVVMGHDYMKFPPMEKRRPSHQGIFDAAKSYREYNQIFADLFSGAEGKKIILFGAGLMAENYIKRHGMRYKPDLIVDNDKLKWDTEKFGVPIRNPEILKTIPEEKRHLIICSFYYKEIESQLADMGIRNYRIYVQKASWITDAER